MRKRLSAARGQTATEYIGVLLVVAMIIGVMAQMGLAARMGAATVEQICRLVNAEQDCPAAKERRRTLAKQLKAARELARDSDRDRVPDRVERRRGLSAFSRDTDRDGVDDAAEVRAGTAGINIGSWDVCRRMLGKATCDTLKAIERASVETARFAVGVLCVDSNLCWKAARTLGVVSGDGRDSVSAILGQTVGGLLTPAAVVDLVKQVLAGKPVGTAIAAVGLIPLAKAPKVPARLAKYIARNPRAAVAIAEKLGVYLGKDSTVLRVLLSKAIPGYSRMRAGGLRHDGVLELMRAGNDLHYLGRSARVLSRPLTAGDRRTINAAIRKHWPDATGNQRTGAYGHEAALALLARNKEIKVLYTGRPRRGGPAGGPDIIAFNTRTNRPIIIEAKATWATDKPLDSGKITKKLKNGTYVQPERAWVANAADRGFIRNLARSSDPLERQAAAHLRDITGNRRARYDVSVMHTRLPGARAYGKVDDSVKRFKADKGIGNVTLVDVDAGARTL